MQSINIAFINVFLEKMTLSKFLHKGSKWDFSVKLKIWRNRNAGRPYASYSTAEASKPKQGPSENTNDDNSKQSIIEVAFLFPSAAKKFEWRLCKRCTEWTAKYHSHRDASTDRSCGLLWGPSLHDFIPPVPLSPFIARCLQISLLPISEVVEVQYGS